MSGVSRVLGVAAAACVLGLPVVGLHGAGVAVADVSQVDAAPGGSGAAAAQRARRPARPLIPAGSSRRAVVVPASSRHAPPARVVKSAGAGVSGADARDVSPRARVAGLIVGAVRSPGSGSDAAPVAVGVVSAASASNAPAPGASVAPAVAPGRISTVAVITRVLNSAAAWLSGLPANPVTEFLSGALLLFRRSVFPNIAEMPACAVSTSKSCAGVNFQGANLAELDLSGVDFEDANLLNATLTNANLTGAKFDYADLSFADLTGVMLTDASLVNANMPGVKLSEAKLAGANLTDAYLAGLGVNLTDADLTGADLTRAALDESILTRANLTRANLTGADLTLTDLTGATLTGANLTGVTWRDTTCPNGSKTDTGCSSGAGNAIQGVSNYQFHWQATWIRTWYDPAHFESYDYTGTLPQNPTFNWSKAGGDYTASFTQDPNGAAHFRIHVNSNSSGTMYYALTLESPMRIAFYGDNNRGFGPGRLGLIIGDRDEFYTGNVLEPGTHFLDSNWFGFLGVRQSSYVTLDLEPVSATG